MGINNTEERSASIRDLPAFVRALIMLGYLAGGAILLLALSCFLFGGSSGLEQLASNVTDMIQSEDITMFDEAADSDGLTVSDNTADTDNTAATDELIESDVSADSDAVAAVAEISEKWICSENDEYLVLTALDKDGNPLWSVEKDCSSRINTNGTIERTLEWLENGNIVYINNASAEKLTAIDRSTGETLWQLNGCFGCPIVYDFGSDGTLYIGSRNEFYGPSCVAVSADGRELWRITKYYTAYDITVCDDYIRVDFDDWGYTYSVDFDFNGNELN